MKNDAFFSSLREDGWRRPLTGAEQSELRARLAGNPEQSDWESEMALTQALGSLPPAPMPSNFTSRVMASLDREETPARAWRWNWHQLIPRMAFATVLMTVAGLTIHHHEIYSQRAALVRSVALVAGGQTVPSADALENFDAIRRMSQPQRADDELLSLMQ